MRKQKGVPFLKHRVYKPWAAPVGSGHSPGHTFNFTFFGCHNRIWYLRF